MAGLTADQLWAQHGPMLKSALCMDMKLRELFMYLTITKISSVKATEEMDRYWINKYRATANSIAVDSVEVLEAQYGSGTFRSGGATHMKWPDGIGRESGIE